MFSEIQAKILRNRPALSAEEESFLSQVLTFIKHSTPDAAQNFSLSDLMGEDLTVESIRERRFNENMSILTFLSSSAQAILSPQLYTETEDGTRVSLGNVEQMQALHKMPGIHPITKEPVDNMATITFLGYRLRPEFVLEHLRHHEPDVRILIVETAESAQKYAIMGVPTVFSHAPEQQDYVRAKILNAVNADLFVVAVRDTLPVRTFLPNPYQVRKIPGGDPSLDEHVRDLTRTVTPWAENTEGPNP